MKLSNLWSVYEMDKRTQGYSKHTLQAYAIQFRLLVEALEDMNIEEITVFHLKQYIAAHSEKLKPSSLEHRIKSLRSFFRYAHEEGIIDNNPAARLKFPKQGQRVPKFLKEETIELLRIGSQSPLESTLIEFMYSAGVRIGEVYRLNRDDFNFSDRSVIVRGKGDKEREVYFSKRAEIWIKRYLKTRQDEDPAFIITESNPKRRMSIAQIRYVVKRIAKRAGVDENVYPHKLRHTYATHLVNRGAPIEVIQQFLGHSKTETTMIYAHLSGEHRREVYRKYF
ncbi:tyrosine-type recombinase/integrase [Halalkalibacter krulwichiae]|uniref:Tyrosine recombinase XerC n=2 Tax=Halalkalibacter krulwichiae TaxID=199441 RepID=A0A1X9MF88_9BACI|nr:tyrosine-type recombinase/integrase [Halalkalibacter krulwichiae]ARK32117.1 Tyrosine recombinase XerC [Halalkalibacter krulwichiae]